MKKLNIAIVTIVLLSGCSSTINKEFNREGEVLSITITNYSSGDKLISVSRGGQGGLNGEAVYSHGDHTCDVSLKTDGIIQVDGEYTKNLGHEMMHCLYGAYHD
jgi:hypothetical protein